MPVLGNKGQVAPRELAKASKKPAPKAARLPATPTKPTALLPTSTAHTGASKVPGPKPAHHSLFSLHTLESAAEGALHAAYGQSAPKGTKGTRSVAPGAAIAAPIPPSLSKAALSDVVQMGEAPFVGGLQLAKASVAGAKGNFGPLGEFGSNVAEGIKHGAIGELAQGHVEGAKRAFREHPGFTLTEAAGLESAAGRTAGAVTRAAGSQAAKTGLRGDLARVGSTVRPPLGLTDEPGLAKQGLVHERTYSKDLNRKAAQVLADSRREPVLDAKGKPVTHKDSRGRTVPVLKASQREQEKLQAGDANYRAAVTQAVEHLEREKGRRSANKIEGRIPPIRPADRLGHELSQLVASGTLRTPSTFKADLQKRIATVEDAIQHPERYRTEGTKANPGELRMARANLKLLKQAAKNPHILKNAPEIVQNGMRYAEELNKGDRRLEGLHIHPPEELHHAALTEYGFAHMGAKHNGDQIVTPEGKPLTPQMIREHALEAGRHPDTIAYVPHVLGTGKKGSFHQPFKPGGRPVFGPHSRTGALYNRGGTAFGTDLAREEMISKRVQASSAEAVDKFVHEAGLRRPDGKHFNASEGTEVANRLNAEGGTQYVPVRAFAAKLPVDEQRALIEDQGSAAMETAHEKLLSDRIVQNGDQSKTRNVVLVPRHMFDQLMAHVTPPGHAERAMQMVNPAFRMAVLPQDKWLMGNILEPYLVRLPLKGAGINLPGSAVDFNAAHQIVRGMEKSNDKATRRTADEIRGLHFGGMVIGRRGASVHRSYKDLSGDAARTFYVAHEARQMPVFKQMADLIVTIPKAYFAFNRKFVEGPAQKIAFGKQARADVQEFTGSWLKTIKIGEQALEQVQKGLINTSTQRRFMREQHKVLGQYDSFNPTMRKFTQTLFPFLPWVLNSLRFVYWTLPAEHSTAFMALVKASQKVQAQWEAEHKDIPPGTLSDALVRKDKGLVDLARYTPWGATIPIAHGQLEGLPSTFAPQFSGAQKALESQDPFGRPLQVPKTAANPKGEPSSGQKIGAAVNSSLESMIPLLSLSRRLREKGGTPYANSTILSPSVKPETSHGMNAFDRTLNPFRPTYVKPKTKKSGGFGSGFGSGFGGSFGGSFK